MKLRRLTLQGYKTFATRTEFVFDSSITAIVGPNGSGKSNVADALRWVLGEQSYSALRAKRSADMIFAGSEQRARAGMAQATILLDNADGWLPIDFAEVEIARRAFRSGENEYLINGQQVRLKDVTDLLATSGLAERTYTIVGQGLVDQALSLRSDERRALFEEAAGITHYKIRRAETLRRLEETQRNLQRVHDIVDELQPRVASLKRQATRTRNYEQISADLRQHLRVWYGFKWEQSKAELRSARAAADAADEAWNSARTALLSLQDRMAATQARLSEADRQLVALRATREQLREQLEARRQVQAVRRERRASLERQLDESQQELLLLQEQQSLAQSELVAALAELHSARSETEAHESRLNAFSAASAAGDREIDQRRNEVARLRTAHQENTTILAQTRGQLVQLRERLAELDLRQPKHEFDETALSALRSRVQDAQQQVGQLGTELAALRQTRAAEIAQLKQMREREKENERELTRLHSQLARLEERVATLDSRSRSELSLQPDRIIGRLAALAEFPPQHAVALRAALGTRLAAWIVRDAADVLQVVEDARRDGSAAHLLVAAVSSGRATSKADVLPHDVTRSAGVIAWAADVLPPGDGVPDLVRSLLGAVLLVDDLAAAQKAASLLPSGGVVVTRDGIVLQGGALVEVVPPGIGDEILTAENRRNEAIAQLEALRDAVARHESESAAGRAALNTQQTRVDERSLEEGDLSRREQEARQQLALLEQSLRQTVRERDALTQRQEEWTSTRDSLQQRVRQIEADITGRQVQLDELAVALEQAQQHLAALPVAESAQQKESLGQAFATAKTIMAGRQAVVDSRRATLNQIDSQLNRLQQRLASLKEQYANAATDDDETAVAVMSAQLKEHDDQLAPIQAGSDADRAMLSRLQAESAALQRHTLELETQLTQARIRLAQQENQIEALQERIRADLGLVALAYDAEQTGATPLPMHEVVEQLPVVRELGPEVEDSIHSLRGQLHRMGPINPDAPAELAVTEERLAFLTAQVEDLTRTDEQLRRIIGELDELTSKAFARTVEQVNTLFDHTFRQLFGGGSGRLAMTDPDDPTSSGVEIIARLPNRREQGLALLSGGERSLTAAALIFSLLRVAPPPFCVLDEVDAALDEANVTRFRELLQELATATQFILITHNRGTVQAAQTLYGVSMQPDSASQVISLKPEEYLQH